MKDYPDRMTAEQARRFGEDVLDIVLAGWPSHSRMVGRTLRYSFVPSVASDKRSSAPGVEELPCHRVVNKEGRTAPGWSRQRELLEEEGVRFKSNGHVDMRQYLWEPYL